MNNNDVLRKIRYIFNFSDAKMKSIFALSEVEVEENTIKAWLKKDDETGFLNLDDETFSIFLNGLIYEFRGKKEGEQPPIEKRLNNNIVLRKLKIALNLKDTDIIELLDAANLRISKPELSAFFRKPEQEKYRLCKDQFLRNFLYGLQLKYRKKE
jgi:uncharacterized protein YehS (DUF1456 family)